MDWARDEWWSALHDMSEMERATSCGHTYSRAGICADCGDDEPRKDM